MKTWKQQKLENGKCLTDLLSATRNGDNDLVQQILGMTELFMLTSSAIDEFLEISQHQPELVLSVFASNKFKKIDLSEFRDDFIRNLTTDFVNKFFALDKIERCRSLRLIDVIEKTNNTDVIKKVLYSISDRGHRITENTLYDLFFSEHLDLALEYLALKQTAPLKYFIHIGAMWSRNPEFIYKVIDIMAVKTNYTIPEFFDALLNL